jgi:hypothetical protein
VTWPELQQALDAQLEIVRNGGFAEGSFDLRQRSIHGRAVDGGVGRSGSAQAFSVTLRAWPVCHCP